MREHDSSGNLITGRTLPLPKVSWVVPADRRLKFDEAASPMPIEGDDRVYDDPPLTNYMEDLLAENGDVKDDCQLQDSRRSGEMNFWSRWHGNFRAIQGSCCSLLLIRACSHCLRLFTCSLGSKHYRRALSDIETTRLGPGVCSATWDGVSRLCEANKVPTSFLVVVSRLQGELAGSRALASTMFRRCKTQADADSDMLHALVPDRTCV